MTAGRHRADRGGEALPVAELLRREQEARAEAESLSAAEEQNDVMTELHR